MRETDYEHEDILKALIYDSNMSEENVRKLKLLKEEMSSLKFDLKDSKSKIETLKFRLDKANSNPSVYENLHYLKLKEELEEFKKKSE